MRGDIKVIKSLAQKSNPNILWEVEVAERALEEFEISADSAFLLQALHALDYAEAWASVGIIHYVTELKIKINNKINEVKI